MGPAMGVFIRRDAAWFAPERIDRTNLFRDQHSSALVRRDRAGKPSQRWLTFKQALALGGNVRKGEKGTMVVYADTFIPKAEQEKASASGEDARRVGFLKRFTVFHVE